MDIAFRFSAHKAAAAIEQMAREYSGIDLHAALKACYFADKSHLNAEHRPIFGATYRAMRFGPVPLQIYEMIKGEIYWLPELGHDSYPWHLEGYRLYSDRNNDVVFDLDAFSDSDKEHFSDALEKSTKMTFTDRTAATHGKDWQNANLGKMNYADMIDESDIKPEIIQHLEENGRFMRL